MKYHIHTYGCQMNVRDSEAVGALLEGRGIARAASEDEADIVLVNTCSVRAKAEDKAMGKLGLLCASKRERPGRIVGVMGCMAQRMADELFRRLPGLNFVVGTRATALVPEAVDRAIAGERRVCLVESPRVRGSESARVRESESARVRESESPSPPTGHGSLETGNCGIRDADSAAPPSPRADVVTAHEPGAVAAYVTILLGCERRCRRWRRSWGGSGGSARSTSRGRSTST